MFPKFIFVELSILYHQVLYYFGSTATKSNLINNLKMFVYNKRFNLLLVAIDNSHTVNFKFFDLFR